jgi:hypothetical protein
VVECPAQIQFGDEWSNVTELLGQLDIGGLPFDIEVTISGADQVGSSGTEDLPSLGMVEVLRVDLNMGADTVAIALGGCVDVQSVHGRSRTSIVRARGAVAQFVAEAGLVEPADEFPFVARPCMPTTPFSARIWGAESDVGISLGRETGEVLLSWSPVDGVVQHVASASDEMVESWDSEGTAPPPCSGWGRTRKRVTFASTRRFLRVSERRRFF